MFRTPSLPALVAVLVCLSGCGWPRDDEPARSAAPVDTTQALAELAPPAALACGEAEAPPPPPRVRRPPVVERCTE